MLAILVKCSTSCVISSAFLGLPGGLDSPVTAPVWDGGTHLSFHKGCLALRSLVDALQESYSPKPLYRT
jgi:hypothetical protein